MSTLNLIAFMIYLYIGLYVIIVDRKSPAHRLFFLMCFSLAFWAFSAIFAFTTEEKDIFLFWFKISSIGLLVFLPLSVHFCIALTRIIRPKWCVLSFLYGPVVFLLYRNFTAWYFYKNFIWRNGQWIFINANDLCFYLYLTYNTLCLCSCIVLLTLWYKKTRSKREKKQAFFVLFSLIATLIAANIEAVIVPIITDNKSFGLSPLILVIWMCGILYSIVKYRFMAMSPELVSREILAGIDESIILLDTHLQTIYINNKTAELINRSVDEIRNYSIPMIVKEHESLSVEIEKMLGNEYSDFACRLHYIVKDNSYLLIDARFSIVKDRLNDIIGILMVGKEVKETRQLKAIYKFTDRQANIIQLIIMGFSNKDIGVALNISERTVKGHISAIFSKLDVSNRMEMLHLLKSFDLVPDQSAEKTIILLAEK